METQNRYDTLNLYETELQIRQILGKETLFFSSYVFKYNRFGMIQERILIITENNFYILEATFTKY